MIRLILCCALVLAIAPLASRAADVQSAAKEPGWSPVIIATGEYRKQLQATPIEERPYRPFHVYGNTVRRIHYRGTPLPTPRNAPQEGDLSRLRVDRRPAP